MSGFGSSFLEPSVGTGIVSSIFDKYAGRRLPVSIRNNNMGAISITGNIDSSWAASMPGFVGTSPRPANEGGYYAAYATPEHGVFAASELLRKYGRGGTDTPMEIVSKWSADRTAWGNYADTLVRYLKGEGINAGRNTELNLEDARVREAILKGKSHYESGAGMPVYQEGVFERGIAGIFGQGGNTVGGREWDNVTTHIDPNTGERWTGTSNRPNGGPLEIGIYGPGSSPPTQITPNPTAPAGAGANQVVETGESVAPTIQEGVEGGLVGFGDWALGAITEPLFRILFVIIGLVFLVAGLYIVSRNPQTIAIPTPA